METDTNSAAKIIEIVIASIVLPIISFSVIWYFFLLLVDRKTVDRVIIRQIVLLQAAGAIWIIAHILLLILTGNSNFCRAVTLILQYFVMFHVAIGIGLALHLVLIFRFHLKNAERYEIWYYIFAIVISALSLLQFFLGDEEDQYELKRCGYLFLGETRFHKVIISFYVLCGVGTFIMIILLILLFRGIAEYREPFHNRFNSQANIRRRVVSINTKYNNTLLRKTFMRLLWFPIFPIVIMLITLINILLDATGVTISSVIYRMEAVIATLGELGVAYLFFGDPIIKRTLQDDRELQNLKKLLMRITGRQKEIEIDNELGEDINIYESDSDSDSNSNSNSDSDTDSDSELEGSASNKSIVDIEINKRGNKENEELADNTNTNKIEKDEDL